MKKDTTLAIKWLQSALPKDRWPPSFIALKEPTRKGFTGVIYSPSDIQTEVLTHAVVSTVERQKTEIKKH